MKKSEVVILTLVVGAIAATSLERQPDTRRHVYSNRDDCLNDYSDTQCRETTGGSGNTMRRWVGPDYRSDSDDAQRGKLASGSETVRRSGFGSSGSRASS